MMWYYTALLLGILYSSEETLEIITSRSDFNHKLTNHNIAFILYCSHDRDSCQHPSSQFADTVSISDRDIYFGYIDCSIHSNLCSHIYTYPIVEIYHSGKRIIDNLNSVLSNKSLLKIADKVRMPFVPYQENTKAKIILPKDYTNEY